MLRACKRLFAPNAGVERKMDELHVQLRETNKYLKILTYYAAKRDKEAKK